VTGLCDTTAGAVSCQADQVNKRALMAVDGLSLKNAIR
jgi:hypothetical protein